MIQIAQDQSLKSTTRKVYDSIYGFITFPKQIWEFIDTPHFQRLRNIKQLGCLSWVFPGAVNTRFQHSLGTGHLAQKYITTLINTHKDSSINKTVYNAYLKQQQRKFAIFTVTLAGVLHDVGHGPYSHLFDSKVVNQIDGKGWEHQIASLCLIDDMYKQVLKTKTNEHDIKWLQSTKDRVQSLIIGKITKAQYKRLENGQLIYEKDGQVDNLSEKIKQTFKNQIKIRPWQFQIVSNRLTGIDVDKLDYFRRDAYYVGAKNIFIEHDLLMNQTLILEQPNSTIFQNNDKEQSERHRLCYPSKYSDKVYDVYYSRYKLYKTFYLNLKSNGVDFMIADILKQSQPYFKFTEACKQLLNGNCEKYIRLTDSIIQKIQDVYDTVKQKIKKNQQLSKQLQGIKNAGQIIEKLKKRQIYDFVKEYHKGFTFGQIGTFYKTRNQIKRLIKNQTAKHPDIVMNCFQIGFGIKDKDPFQQCRFYDKSEEIKQIQTQNQRHFSMLRPQRIVELYLSVYLKNRIKNPTIEDKKRIQALKKQILQQIKKIDEEFISGHAGTYTNRSQSVPITGNPKQMKTQQQKMKQNFTFDDQL